MRKMFSAVVTAGVFAASSAMAALPTSVQTVTETVTAADMLTVVQGLGVFAVTVAGIWLGVGLFKKGAAQAR